MEKQDFDNAVKYMKLSFGDNPTFEQSYQVADLLSRVGDAMMNANRADEAKATYQKAIDSYKEMKEKFPKYKTTCNYLLADTYSKLDPDSKQGLAKPYYDEIVSTLGSVADLQAGEKQMLNAAYFYLMVYEYNVKKNPAGAKDYAQKLLVIDPENETAKQVLGK